MNTPFNLRRRSSYPWWFGGIALLSVVSFMLLPDHFQSAQLLLSIIGGIAAFFHFLYSQHNSNTDRFIKLFQEFNERYDELNSRLNSIYLNSSTTITDEKDIQILYDYFNLCAEEHLYFVAGYIDGVVWSSWLAGMHYFAANSEIKNLWLKELSLGSYYGFPIELLDPQYRQGS